MPTPDASAAASQARPSLLVSVAQDATIRALQDRFQPALFSSLQWQAGGLSGLIEHVRQAGSQPDLLLIELPQHNADDALSDLQMLAPYINDNVRVFAFGSVNDVDFYRALIRLGIEDYSVGPPDADHIMQIASSAQRGPRAEHGLKLGFAGLAGGVGTSTLALNLALRLADQSSVPITLIDLRPPAGSLTHLFSEDYLAACDNPEPGIIRLKPRLHLNLLFAGSQVTRPSSSDVDALIRAADTAGHAVLVDFGTVADAARLRCTTRFDHLLYVGEPDFRSLTTIARDMDALANTIPAAQYWLALNKTGMRDRLEFPAKDFSRSSGLACLTFYRNDPAAYDAAVMTGAPLLPDTLLDDRNSWQILMRHMPLAYQAREPDATSPQSVFAAIARFFLGLRS